MQTPPVQRQPPPPHGRQSRLALGLFMIVVGGLALGIRGLGWVGEHSAQILNVPQLTVAEALDYRGPVKGPLRIDGLLSTDLPVTMPDTGELVLRAFLTIRLEGRAPGEREARTLRTLYRTEDLAPIAVEDDGLLLPMEVRPFELPLFHDPDVQVSEIYDGDALVEVLYGDWRFPVDPSEWEGMEVSVSVDRASLPIGLRVATLGALDGSGESPRMVPLPKMRVEVYERSKRNFPPQRPALGALAVVIGIGGLLGGGWLIRRWSVMAG